MSRYEDISYKIACLNRKFKHLGVTHSNHAIRGKTLFTVRIAPADVDNAFDWCDEQFGDNWVWSSVVPWEHMDLLFLKPEDALVCRLKYSTIIA